MKQEGKSMDSEKGEGSIDLDTYNPHSPSYMLGPQSPTSMEWTEDDHQTVSAQNSDKETQNSVIEKLHQLEQRKREYKLHENNERRRREATTADAQLTLKCFLIKLFSQPCRLRNEWKKN